ncbi:DUF3999 family protein [Paraglaciecola aestuariivivens]
MPLNPFGAFCVRPLAIIVSSLFFIASGCGGGKANNTTQIPLPNPTPTPEQPAPEPEPSECENQIYSIASASDDGNFVPNYAPANAIDNNTAAKSRWVNNGSDAALVLDLASEQSVQALTIKWYRGDQRVINFSVETSNDQQSWTPILVNAETSGKDSGFELVELEQTQARYLKIIGLASSDNNDIGIVEVQVHSCPQATGQFSGLLPSELGIELLDWYLSVPSDDDNSGTSDSISETQLADGYNNSEYFYASADGGIVFRSPSHGFKTSTNTNYVRVELREMLRRGDRSISTKGVNKNNWVFSSASTANQSKAGGVDGDLKVTLAVNQVTQTGENYQIGRVVIGQIHANDDEPIRLYYRKLPNNTLGSVYFAHESRVTDSDGDNIETYVEMIGSRSNSAANPADGIALDEKFSYHINVTLNLLTVTISREGKDDVVASYDMSDSLYDQDDQYHYFKAGVYNLNNSSDPAEYVQATFYEIKNAHTGYSQSE